MFRSGRINVSKARLIIGLFLAFAICAGWIGYGLSKSAEYGRQANDQRAEYSEYTRKKIDQTCVGIPKLEAIKCKYDAFNAQRENNHNQSDLVAQRQSALWAYIMGTAAVIGIALSAVGVWLVKTTFDETRKSNTIAAAAAASEYGASLTILGGHVQLSRGRIHVRLKVKNIGKSPAHRVSVSGKYTAYADILTRGADVVEDEISGSIYFFSADTIMPDDGATILHAVWSGKRKSGIPNADVIEKMAENGENAAISFKIVLDWATAFSALNKIGIAFTIYDMRGRKAGDSEYQIKDVRYFLVE